MMMVMMSRTGLLMRVGIIKKCRDRKREENEVERKRKRGENMTTFKEF